MVDWEIKHLGSIAELSLGKMLDQNKNRGEYRPYLANINVRWGSFNLENQRTMRFEKDEFERYGLKNGDILMCEGGEPGRCAIWKDRISGMMYQKALHRIRPLKDSDSIFVYYCLLNLGQSKEFDQYCTGSTIKHLPLEKLGRIPIPLPPLPIQRRIAGILSAYDDLIENCQKRIKILETMARSLYREWFVAFRFPGHEKIKLVKSKLGMIPEGWEARKLIEVADVNRDQINLHNAPEALLYIDISSVSPGQIDTITTHTFANAPGRARRIVQHGDVLWSCVRPNRRSYAQVMHPEPNTIASTGFAVLTAKKTPSTFLYFATTMDDFVGYLSNNATGAAYPAVTAAIFEKADLLIPPLPLLTKFGEVTIPITEQVHSLQQKTRNLRHTRDLLLPRLMSGKIDIS